MDLFGTRFTEIFSVAVPALPVCFPLGAPVALEAGGGWRRLQELGGGGRWKEGEREGEGGGRGVRLVGFVLAGVVFETGGAVECEAASEERGEGEGGADRAEGFDLFRI